MRRAAIALAWLVAGLALGACTSATSAGSGEVQVVAAEDFWGSIAAQIAGSKAHVTSIITNPAQDPHSYEPTANDARTMATANLAIVNGIGYDPWAPKLLAASPLGGRLMLNVGELLGLHLGANPHRWYDPTDVVAVARAIAGDLGRLEPSSSAYFQDRLNTFLTRGLSQYDSLIARARARYAGVPVGASESVFALQAAALGLRLMTPYSFMKAVSEGTEVNAQDSATTAQQITAHLIKVWIYNSQNATPEVQRLDALARTAHIPMATITETLNPAGDSFQQWQVFQLQRIEQALQSATGR